MELRELSRIVSISMRLGEPEPLVIAYMVEADVLIAGDNDFSEITAKLHAPEEGIVLWPHGTDTRKMLPSFVTYDVSGHLKDEAAFRSLAAERIGK